MAAEIPALLSMTQQQEQDPLFVEPRYQQQWGWRDGQRPKLSPNEEKEFIRTYAWPKETELALQCLFKGDYDVPRAVELIHAARRQTLRLNEEETERVHKITFERAMDRHGKKFHLVKRRIGKDVTTGEVVSKFYMWKVTPEYEKWHDGQREKKRKREAKRLEQLQVATDQHREYCEVCLKDGKLLCCDGCERACHLNCVRPALLDVPEGDWFCSHCRDAAKKTSPSMKRIASNALGVNTSTRTSTMRSKKDRTRSKDGSNLPFARPVRGFGKKMKGDESTMAKHALKTRPTTNRRKKPDGKIDTKDLDGISDITTESESDGGAANVFQSLSSNCAVTAPLKKRKHKSSAIQTVANRPRGKTQSSGSLDVWSCSVEPVCEKRLILPKQKHTKAEPVVSRYRHILPVLSLEYCSNPVTSVLRDSVSLQLETTSASRKRKRRYDVSPSTLQLQTKG